MNSFTKFIIVSWTVIMTTLLVTGCETPLQGAARTGNTREIVKLLDEGNDIQGGATMDGRAPILHAIIHKQNAAVILLVEKGANLGAYSEYFGMTPLHLAVEYDNDPTVIQAMITAGAEINAREEVWGRTPLHVAAGRGNLEAVKLLLEAGADASILTSKGLSASDLAFKSGSRDKLAIVQLLNNNSTRGPGTPQAAQTPTPEPVVIPQMNAPE